MITNICHCPICGNLANNSNIVHQMIGNNLFDCGSCSYRFVDCSKMTKKSMYKHQNLNSHSFGKNLQRNIEYLNLLTEVKKKKNIKRLLEIGTPKNYDFLKKVHNRFNTNIKLYSHDLLENKTPEFINFYSKKDELFEESIDILFCIHTLEHIPTNEIIEFINFCKKVSKYFVFEVPYCPTRERVMESTRNPHYSFFTEKSIEKLFGKKIDIHIRGKVIKFNNLRF